MNEQWWSSDALLCRGVTGVLAVMPKRISYYAIRLFRYIEGDLGLSLRYACYKRICHKLGKDVQFAPAIYILFPQNLSIGDRSTLHEFSIVECNGGVEIGADTSIAHKFSLMSSTHKYSVGPQSHSGRKYETKATRIGNSVWIGAGVIVTYGVTINDNSVIGAQSFVNKDVPSGTMAAGVPAKPIKVLP